MKNVFFTGATGLLGEYLLRDGLRSGERFVVLARPGKLESARGRIESMLARIEENLDRPLPRPVVLEGNLSAPNLGLASQDLTWVSKNCDRILHNAASLVFYTDEKTGEPARSNINGTQNVLGLAEETGIRTFFHVSTSYICGLRNDLCLESQLDVGQDFGNDYERSKVAAEKMVRSAAFLDSLTVFRPAIIIGDSKTGYTSTYHGFFTPLKVAHVLTANGSGMVLDGSPLLKAIGFDGSERKNFVPVDWVSEVMTLVMRQRESWGETYQLVPRNRVSVTTTMRVFEEVLRRFYADKAGKKASAVQTTWTDVQEMFRSQMSVYRSYWRDDPEFDYTNVTRVAPQRPCPDVDFAMLLRMAAFALENGFGWPIKPPVLPEIDIDEKLNALRTNASAGTFEVGLQVNGRGGGQWTLAVVPNSPMPIVGIASGLPVDSESLIYMNSETFVRLVRRLLTAVEALQSGCVSVRFDHRCDATPPQFPELLLNVLAQ